MYAGELERVLNKAMPTLRIEDRAQQLVDQFTEGMIPAVCLELELHAKAITRAKEFMLLKDRKKAQEGSTATVSTVEQASNVQMEARSAANASYTATLDQWVEKLEGQLLQGAATQFTEQQPHPHRQKAPYCREPICFRCNQPGCTGHVPENHKSVLVLNVENQAIRLVITYRDMGHHEGLVWRQGGGTVGGTPPSTPLF